MHRDDKEDCSQEVRRKIFDKLFRLKYAIRVAPAEEVLQIDCILFTEDLRYLIVASERSLEHSPNVNPDHMHRNNESVEPNPLFKLKDYSIYVVDMKHGVLRDTTTFKSDTISLPNNEGLYLYKDTLAVLSVQHQTISVFHMKDGIMVPFRTIGRFCCEEDDVMYSCEALNIYVAVIQ
jgi:de-etiolated-1